MFVWNILLALAWAALSGNFTLNNALLGFLAGYCILFMTQPVTGRSAYFNKVRQVIGFLGFYLWEVIIANLRIAYDVMTPRLQMRPGVIAIVLDAETDLEITLVANLLGLTPGTLSLDVSSDRRVLYIHALYLDDIDEFRRSVKEGMERRALEVLR